jgi:hypothetical protein
MWYEGLESDCYSMAGWRYAESPDGITWNNRMAVSQAVGGTSVFGGVVRSYGIADAVFTPGASNSGTDWEFTIYANVEWAASGNELVIMAFSSNGYQWRGYDPTPVGYATPVFQGTGNSGDFDKEHIGWFKVIKNSATDWEAFYSGGDNWTYKALNGIGYATSTDGRTWVRSQTLFTTNDAVAWRNQSVWMPSVVKTGSTYQIWFLGSNDPDIDSTWISWKVGGANLTVNASPTPVGGTVFPVNKLLVIAPWLGLLTIIPLMASVAALRLRRVRNQR